MSGTMPCQRYFDWGSSTFAQAAGARVDRWDASVAECLDKPQTCDAMEEWFEATGYKFGSAEMYLPESAPGGDLCQRFKYVFIMRNPLDRITSEMRKHPDDVLQYYDLMLGSKGFALARPGSALRSTASVSNYYIRGLLGASVFFLPISMVNETHLRQARDVLQKFALVLPLEQLNSRHARELLRRKVLPCLPKSFEVPDIRNPGLPRMGWQEAIRSFPNVDALVLQYNNELDMSLYEHVQDYFWLTQLSAAAH